MRIEDKLNELQIELSNSPKAAAVYLPAVLVDNIIYVSGQTPKDGDRLLYKGKVGSELTIEDGIKAAEICAIRCISILKSMVGDLDKIERIIKLTGYVNCSGEFEKQSLVIDGASKLLENN